jgi:hypothetical protein
MAPSTYEVTDVSKRITTISDKDAVLMLKEVTAITSLVLYSVGDIAQL